MSGERRRRLFFRAGMVLVLSSGLWVVGQLGYGNWGIALFFAVVSALGMFLLYHRERLGLDRVAVGLTAMLLVVIGVGAIVGGGLAGTNACLFITVPVGALTLGERRGLWWTLPALAWVGALAWLHERGFVFPNLIPEPERPLDAALTWVTSLLVIAYLAWEYERAYLRATAELRAAQAEAVRATRSKAEFVARVSHEVRTPLHALLGLMEAMEGEDDPAVRQAQAQQAQTTAHMLAHVLEDLLDLSRAESTGIELRRQAFSPGLCVEQVIEILAARAADRGNVLTGRVASDVPAWVWGDGGRLQQVLVNLAGNAIKFTARGRVEVAAAVAAAEGGERLLFEVRDDGVGIPAEEQARIFEAFQQAGTEASRSQGIGLGLDISRRLVDAMGGRLQVESQPGRGSRFFFSLPLERSEGPASAVSSSSEVDPGLDGMKVLLAEDDEANRKLTELMLRKIGCQVAAVGDGQAALAALRRERFDLVLLDIHMPVMDGSEAARQAREMAKRGEIAALPPMVAMTANTGYADEATRRRAGMDDALIKPFQRAELQRVLRQWRKGGETS